MNAPKRNTVGSARKRPSALYTGKRGRIRILARQLAMRLQDTRQRLECVAALWRHGDPGPRRSQEDGPVAVDGPLLVSRIYVSATARQGFDRMGNERQSVSRCRRMGPHRHRVAADVHPGPKLVERGGVNPSQPSE